VKDFILDASLTLSWCFPDEKTPYSAAILTMLEADAEAIVPALWPLEIANALVVAERGKRITYDQTQEFLADILHLEIRLEPITSSLAFSHRFHDIYALARKHSLTAYDAAYLELAIRRGIPLASLDGALNKAALASGVNLVQPPPASTGQRNEKT
jgi:predicted nucleic acid-binding protein